MQIARYQVRATGRTDVGVVEENRIHPLAPGVSLSQILHSPDPEAAAREALDAQANALLVETVDLQAPLDAQEVWGAGVTYERSKVARKEESHTGGDFYEQVYQADRPELFFKATPNRVVGPGNPVRVRRDTQWCVPEPELALVIAPDLRLVGFTIGNDMSARDIEGRNPLYLPQAKLYDACCALGPVVTLADPHATPEPFRIQLTITRDHQLAYEGETSTARLARSFTELIDWLGRDNCFPNGVILLTGTGIVPPDEFSLRSGDEVAITIERIGTLVNPVIQGNVTG